MDQYQFLKVLRRMEVRYGKMKKNEEGKHAVLLFAMESNVLKIHRRHPAANSRRMEEAVVLALYGIESRLTGEVTDIGRYENCENALLKEGLLKAFDPYEEKEIGELLHEKGVFHPENKEELAVYYKEPVACLLRIRESVDCWLKRGGADGYFEFLERYMGAEVPDDDKMNYAICMEQN